MKIIRRGVPPSERLYRCSCVTCTTLFEFKQNEARLQSDQREGSYYSINCPVCSAVCSVSPNSYVRDNQTREHNGSFTKGYYD